MNQVQHPHAARPEDRLAPLIVLVHGAWHGAWAWGHVQYELACRGRPSLAIDLLAHGLSARLPVAPVGAPIVADPAREPGRDRHLTLADAARDLATRIHRLREGSGRPVALVAHSLGGAVATAVAEIASESLACLVYVCALTPVAGTSIATYLELRARAGAGLARLQIGSPAELGVVRIDLMGGNALDQVRRVFFSGIDPDTAHIASHMLTPDVPAHFISDTVETSSRWGSVKRLYVACTQDEILPLAVQRQYIDDMDRASGSATDTMELEAAHSPFLSHPRELAGIIDSYARV